MYSVNAQDPKGGGLLAPAITQGTLMSGVFRFGRKAGIDSSLHEHDLVFTMDVADLGKRMSLPNTPFNRRRGLEYKRRLWAAPDIDQSKAVISLIFMD